MTSQALVDMFGVITAAACLCLLDTCSIMSLLVDYGSEGYDLPFR